MKFSRGLPKMQEHLAVCTPLKWPIACHSHPMSASYIQHGPLVHLRTTEQTLGLFSKNRLIKWPTWQVFKSPKTLKHLKPGLEESAWPFCHRHLSETSQSSVYPMLSCSLEPLNFRDENFLYFLNQEQWAQLSPDLCKRMRFSSKALSPVYWVSIIF